MTSVVTSELTLDDVAGRFKLWRSTKKPRGRIPSDLWGLVKSIIGHYKIGRICQALRISFSQLQREGVVPPSKPRKNELSDDETFVSVQLESALATVGNTHQSTLEFKRADGLQLTLTQPSMDHLNLFISSIME